MDSVMDRVKGKEKAIAALIGQVALVVLLFVTTGEFNYQEVLAIVMGLITIFGVYETTNRPAPPKRRKRRRDDARD